MFYFLYYFIFQFWFLFPVFQETIRLGLWTLNSPISTIQKNKVRPYVSREIKFYNIESYQILEDFFTNIAKRVTRILQKEAFNSAVTFVLMSWK
jgi:hypothetical protein